MKPINTVTVRVVRIVEDYDCRQIRRLQQLAYRLGMNDREVVLAFNRTCTIARAADADGNIFTAYAFEGYKFDVERLLHGGEHTFGIHFKSDAAVTRGKLRLVA
jgi:hypothetical protein